MGQQEVFDFLRKNPRRWWTSKQIAEKVGVSIGSVTTSLVKLRKDSSIIYKKSDKINNQYLYRYKK